MKILNPLCMCQTRNSHLWHGRTLRAHLYLKMEMLPKHAATRGLVTFCITPSLKQSSTSELRPVRAHQRHYMLSLQPISRVPNGAGYMVHKSARGPP